MTGYVAEVQDPASSRGVIKIGIDVAVEALRDYRRLREGSVDELWGQAAPLRMTRVIRPYCDAIAS